jgi:hypothetical protein
MSFSDWWEKSVLRTREFGLRGVKWSVLDAVTDLHGHIGRRFPIGTNVYERDWDVLVLLDGCRVDSLETAMTDRAIDYEQDSLWSVGSQSKDWIQNTFGPASEEVRADTAYVTANPYSVHNIDEQDIGLLDEVWNYAWDDDLETVPPRPVTDRAIRVGRDHDYDRLIVHYMQPHAPFIAEDAPYKSRGFGIDRDLTDKNTTPLNRDSWFNAIKYGDVDRDTVWESYMKTLSLVLDDVEVLLENLDADTVVFSADHGNAFGEYLTYGHPGGVLHPQIRKVPWFTTSATDERTHEPDDVDQSESDRDTEEMLRSLGYL